MSKATKAAKKRLTKYTKKLKSLDLSIWVLANLLKQANENHEDPEAAQVAARLDCILTDSIRPALEDLDRLLKHLESQA